MKRKTLVNNEKSCIFFFNILFATNADTWNVSLLVVARAITRPKCSLMAVKALIGAGRRRQAVPLNGLVRRVKCRRFERQVGLGLCKGPLSAAADQVSASAAVARLFSLSVCLSVCI